MKFGGLRLIFMDHLVWYWKYDEQCHVCWLTGNVGSYFLHHRRNVCIRHVYHM